MRWFDRTLKRAHRDLNEPLVARLKHIHEGLLKVQLVLMGGGKLLLILGKMLLGKLLNLDCAGGVAFLSD